MDSWTVVEMDCKNDLVDEKSKYSKLFIEELVVRPLNETLDPFSLKDFIAK